MPIKEGISYRRISHLTALCNSFLKKGTKLLVVVYNMGKNGMPNCLAFIDRTRRIVGISIEALEKYENHGEICMPAHEVGGHENYTTGKLFYNLEMLKKTEKVKGKLGDKYREFSKSIEEKQIELGNKSPHPTVIFGALIRFADKSIQKVLRIWHARDSVANHLAALVEDMRVDYLAIKDSPGAGPSINSIRKENVYEAENAKLGRGEQFGVMDILYKVSIYHRIGIVSYGIAQKVLEETYQDTVKARKVYDDFLKLLSDAYKNTNEHATEEVFTNSFAFFNKYLRNPIEEEQDADGDSDEECEEDGNQEENSNGSGKKSQSEEQDNTGSADEDGKEHDKEKSNDEGEGDAANSDTQDDSSENGSPSSKIGEPRNPEPTEADIAELIKNFMEMKEIDELPTDLKADLEQALQETIEHRYDPLREFLRDPVEPAGNEWKPLFNTREKRTLESPLALSAVAAYTRTPAKNFRVQESGRLNVRTHIRSNIAPGHPTTAEVFDRERVGVSKDVKICILADTSGSMSAPIDNSVKIIYALCKLGEMNSRVKIRSVFTNSQCREALVIKDYSEKTLSPRAIELMKTISPCCCEGLSSSKYALENPKPDLVIFLTDACISTDDFDYIQALRAKMPVWAVYCGNELSEPTPLEIAFGKYVFERNVNQIGPRLVRLLTMRV